MGHSIDQLALVQQTVFQPLGLFGVIGKTGVVRDVGVVRGSLLRSVGSSGILAGDNQGVIVHAYTTGNVSDPDHAAPVASGGLTGTNEGLIARSWSSASISSDQANGGLVGINSGTITQSYATGNVAPATIFTSGGGGLVGDNLGTITQSYATGNVTSFYSAGAGVGGLVGSNEGTISQSFATGRVQWDRWNGPSGVGGIVALNWGIGGTIAPNVYWNKCTTGQANGGGNLPAANGLTTAQMSTPSSFASYDFSPTGVWAMPAGATHPILRWQLAN
jgi:hypothetical protein